MATGIPKTQWNGKIAEKDTPSLGIHLCYEGKMAYDDVLQIPAAQFQHLWGENLSNQLYFGDNLPVLAYLLQQPHLAGNVRLVYIDPPFSTGSVFKSRNHHDAYTDLLVGANYLEFLRRRLIFLYELLAEDGSLYIHLDSNMVFQAKLILDEIFGSGQLRSFITRKKCNPKNYTRRTYGNISDYILFYSKTDHYVWNRPYESWQDERAMREYAYVDEATGRRFKKVPLHAPGERNGETGKPWRDLLPPKGKHWQYPPSVLEEMDQRGDIYWSANGNPRRKIYLDQSEGIPIQDIWLDVKDAHNQNIKITGYPTEKPMELLQRIIKASSNESDIVLDCFGGSGTTLDAATQLGRQWIGIDNSVEAIKTTLKRFKNGLEIMGDFVTAKIASPQLSLFQTDPQKLFGLSAVLPYENDLAHILAEFLVLSDEKL